MPGQAILLAVLLTATKRAAETKPEAPAEDEAGEEKETPSEEIQETFCYLWFRRSCFRNLLYLAK